VVCLPRSQRRLIAFLNQPRHGAAISSRARRLASIRTWEYRESITSSPGARLRKLRDQRVTVVVLQKSCAADRSTSRREPLTDKSPPPARPESKESPPSPERVPVQEDAQSWYFRGFPFVLEVFPGISGAFRWPWTWFQVFGGPKRPEGKKSTEETSLARSVVVVA
jgi:hypothetical protein